MLVSTFSMYPLLAKDGLTYEYLAVCALFATTTLACLAPGTIPKSNALKVLVRMSNMLYITDVLCSERPHFMCFCLCS